MSGRAFFGVMVHYRLKNTRKQFVVGPFRSFPFTLVQRCYGRASKHPLVVRPDPLTPYVHRPFERTTKEAYVVRPSVRVAAIIIYNFFMILIRPFYNI